MIPPFERLTPWKDMAAELANAGRLSHQDFYQLGITKIVYLKIIGTADNQPIFQIYSASGQLIYDTQNLDMALDWVILHNLIPVPLH